MDRSTLTFIFTLAGSVIGIGFVFLGPGEGNLMYWPFGKQWIAVNAFAYFLSLVLGATALSGVIMKFWS